MKTSEISVVLQCTLTPQQLIEVSSSLIHKALDCFTDTNEKASYTITVSRFDKKVLVNLTTKTGN